MDFIRRELAGITLGAAVGDEMHLITARLQRMRERLRRKNMAAGSPGGKKNNTLAHDRLLRGNAGTDAEETPLLRPLFGSVACQRQKEAGGHADRHHRRTTIRNQR
ncbi:hypothetical protein D3C72_1625840 [compost metagenome]